MRQTLSPVPKRASNRENGIKLQAPCFDFLIGYRRLKLPGTYAPPYLKTRARPCHWQSLLRKVMSTGNCGTGVLIRRPRFAVTLATDLKRCRFTRKHRKQSYRCRVVAHANPLFKLASCRSPNYETYIWCSHPGRSNELECERRWQEFSLGGSGLYTPSLHVLVPPECHVQTKIVNAWE